MVEVGLGVGVVVAMDEPSLGQGPDGRQLHVQRTVGLEIAQQHDGLWPDAFYRLNDGLEIAVRIAEEHELGGLVPIVNLADRG